MTLTEWAPLALVCLLGAMSPGPSLALVVRHAATKGAASGVFCAVTHGAGIFLWASVTATGLGAVIVSQPTWFEAIRAVGALFLLYLGLSALLSRQNEAGAAENPAQPEYARVGWEGFLIALSNPKIAVFFVALFSQFVEPEASILEQFLIAATAAVIDAAWYALVAISISSASLMGQIKSRATLLNRCFGAILIGLSLTMLGTLWID
tara:strand:- start:155 stop:778 length:624 start_codon:yes stop_codon:yes gene_type:complete